MIGGLVMDGEAKNVEKKRMQKRELTWDLVYITDNFKGSAWLFLSGA